MRPHPNTKIYRWLKTVWYGRCSLTQFQLGVQWYIYICILCVSVCVHIYVYIYTYSFPNIHIYSYMCACVYAFVCMCIHTYMYVIEISKKMAWIWRRMRKCTWNSLDEEKQREKCLYNHNLKKKKILGI